MPTFFATETDFRRWLEANHDSAGELLVGFWKKGTGKPSIDWPQARDQALCFGWIDGQIYGFDEDYSLQVFTPRRPRSVWSQRNVGIVERLIDEGRMRAAGLALRATRR